MIKIHPNFLLKTYKCLNKILTNYSLRHLPPKNQERCEILKLNKFETDFTCSSLSTVDYKQSICKLRDLLDAALSPKLYSSLLG